MVQAEEIAALCRKLGAGEGQDELLLPLAGAAAAWLEKRLKPGVAAEDCRGAFPVAAAMVTMDHWSEAVGEAGVTAFTAGEVSIRTEKAEHGGLTAQALRLLSPWLKEGSFAFLGVDG